MYTLKLDIDEGMERPTVNRINRKLWRAGFQVVRMNKRFSPGGTGWHIEIEVDPEPESLEVVVALQTILGSDPMREACNLYRARMVAKGSVPKWMQERWNVLYK